MRVLVCVDVAVDVRVPPERDPRSGRVRQDWLVAEVDPAGARALDLALALTEDRPNGAITVLHLGPAASEPFLRRALARGCYRAIRVWDEEAANARTAGKALILAAAAGAAGYDLVLTGDRGVIGAGGQLGVLVAARLGVPCVTEVGAAELSPDSHRLHAVRELERGFREKVEVTLPAVITVSASPGAAGSAGGAGGADGAAPAIGAVGADTSARALLAALEQEIPVWTLADLGVAPGAVRDVDRPLELGLPRPRRPRLHPIAPPDPTLPAFDRILALVRGSVKSREGRVVRRPADEVAQEVFQVLRDEGWLDHLRPRGSSSADAPGSASGSSASGGGASGAGAPGRDTTGGTYSRGSGR
jgi:electron transfer flavoprotein beta subunit